MVAAPGVPGARAGGGLAGGARAAAVQGGGLAADAAAAAAACLAAQALLPAPARTAMLYAGLGALWGQGAARPCPRTGAAAACAWLVLYLPFTGALACLGGGALTLAAGFPALGAVAVPVAAAPMALLQFGPEGALGVLGAAAAAGLARTPGAAPHAARPGAGPVRAVGALERALKALPSSYHAGRKMQKERGRCTGAFSKKVAKISPHPLDNPVVCRL